MLNTTLMTPVYYHPNDKIVIIATGEVFTVVLDLSQKHNQQDRGIQVIEHSELINHDDVRAAGKTRQRFEAIQASRRSQLKQLIMG